MYAEIVQEQSTTAHLKLRDLSSKYVQIAGARNSLNSGKQLLPPGCYLAVVQMPEQPGTGAQLPGCFSPARGLREPDIWAVSPLLLAVLLHGLLCSFADSALESPSPDSWQL